MGAGGGAGGGGWRNCGGGGGGGWGVASSGWPTSTPGVSEAPMIGTRGGMAATVGGESVGPTATVPCSTGLLSAGSAAGELIERMRASTRCDSRRLRSSDTLSVGVCLDAGFLGGACGLAALGGALSGSFICTCANDSEGRTANCRQAANAAHEPARRQGDAWDNANDEFIATRSEWCG